MADLPGFLVENGIGPNRKIRRLTPPERWCVVAGVWAIASMSPVRGYLLISEGVPATEEDYADQAGVPLSVAKSCVAKLRRLGMLELDPNQGVEHVHDWHKHQPEASRKPSDTREAWRERKAKQRANRRDGHADVPRDVTPPDADVTRGIEEKRKKGTTAPQPPQAGEPQSRSSASPSNGALSRPSLVPPAGRRRSGHARYRADLLAWASSPAAVPSDAERAAAGRVADALRALPESAITLQVAETLHAHRGDDDLLILCATAQVGVDFVSDRYGRVIGSALPDGARWQLVDCGCGTARLAVVA